MSAGTLTLTNNSVTVTGTGTAFTTDLKANDFIVVIVGGVTYTLGVKATASAISLTLITPYGGPTASGNAWTAVPNATLVGITAQVAADVAKAIRGLNLDKANWQQVFSGTGPVTVTLPDGSTYTGPAWSSLKSAAFADIGEGAGNVMGSGAFGLGLQGSHAAFNLDTSPAMISLLSPKGMVPFRNEANISGRINGTSPGIWIRTGGVFAYISIPHFDAGNVYISGGLIADGAPTSARMLYDNKNTTKASNGVLSAASPVARVVQSKSACLRPDIAEDSFEWCGDGVANSEARGIEIKRTAVGVYSVTGSMGFAEDSWHLKAPADPAGNGDLAIVEGEQAEDGTLTIKLFKKRYKLNEESGDIDLIPGIPMDVPANSWIDVRMEMPASKVEHKTDVAIETTT
ncbi:hypothetical protein AB6870_23520 [Rahnella inusitata]|uniref:phage tail fiber protein n=1 Tax=Rahnella inusitata TaxID=58169 RepID=UPI0039BE9192